MLKHAMISVRSQSTRLQNKCFKQLNGKSILEFVVARCKHFGFEPVVSTTYWDSKIQLYCHDNGVKCYAGSVNDKLLRWKETCDVYSIDKFVTVDCDDPLFDPVLAKILFDKCSTAVISPDLNAYLGSHGWGISYEHLTQICESKISNATEMIWKHFPSELNVKQMNASPAEIEKKIRLTLDYEEDYWLISTVVRELGEHCERSEIIGFFEDNPGLTSVNLFRNDQWKLNQNV